MDCSAGLPLPELGLALAEDRPCDPMAGSQVFHYGDNLGVMREMGEETVDLVYLDPPFNSERAYSTSLREADGSVSEAQRVAFEDFWRWGPEAEKAYDDIVLPRHQRQHIPAKLSETMQLLKTIHGPSNLLAYLAMMAVRLVHMRRVLKSTGALYLHCDPTASHYLKLLLDALFGPDRFANEIIWQRTNARVAADRWPRVHDVLLFYTKSEHVTFQPLRVPGAPSKLPHTLITGPNGEKYQTFELTAPELRFGETGNPWRGFQPADLGRHWANTHEVMNGWDKQGLIHWPKKKGAWPRRRAKEPFEPSERMVTVGDVWTDIDRLNQTAKERLGYPTQKPLALLSRIIEASSAPGDLVLDPFCGCGTTIEAAQRLNRRWIGIDVTHLAVSVLKRRMEANFPGLAFEVRGEPRDYQSASKLAHDNRFEFQAWIVDRAGGVPTDPPKKKHVAKGGGDGGVDGWLMFRDDPKASRSRRLVISVKSDATPTPAMVRELIGTVQDRHADGGVLLLLNEPTSGMQLVARNAGSITSDTFAPGKRFPKIQILSVRDLLERKMAVEVPGWNSSHQSVPPTGTAGATLPLFEQSPKRGPRKGRTPAEEQQALPIGKKP